VHVRDSNFKRLGFIDLKKKQKEMQLRTQKQAQSTDNYYEDIATTIKKSMQRNGVKYMNKP